MSCLDGIMDNSTWSSGCRCRVRSTTLGGIGSLGPGVSKISLFLFISNCGCPGDKGSLGEDVLMALVVLGLQGLSLMPSL